MKIRSVIAVVLGVLVVSAMATPISFSPAEGYVEGDIEGQPGDSGSLWARTHNNSTNNMTVLQGSSASHTDYLKIQLSTEHGSSDVPTTVDYATKRMIPVDGQFMAGFSVFNSFRADNTGDETVIALGQAADSGWGPYMGMNKLTEGSMAYHNGTEWIELTTDIAEQKWYDVELNGNVSTGLFSVSIFKEEDRVDGEPASGLVATASNLPFRDLPTELGYVMLSNEGSSRDTGGYSHHYDDLYLTPEPATLALLAIGSVALIRRR